MVRSHLALVVAGSNDAVQPASSTASRTNAVLPPTTRSTAGEARVRTSRPRTPKSEWVLKVFETETLGPYAPTPIPGPATLCYQHGPSSRRCSASPHGMWTVRLLSGHDQFFTLRVSGKTVARIVYHKADIPGRPAPSEAPAVV